MQQVQRQPEKMLVSVTRRTCWPLDGPQVQICCIRDRDQTEEIQELEWDFSIIFPRLLF